MNKSKKAFGSEGEALVRSYLIKNGYEHIASNYTVKGGEIDLIMMKDGVISFIEVKTRTLESAMKFGRGASAVNENKRRRIAYCAGRYIFENPSLCENVQFRFDIAELYRDKSGKLFFRHFENAFFAQPDNSKLI
ncbi:MAG: YraN family protein [Oscillospiraceae bacterium]|nr:YraN family protein [Oscillospiraceae bacterium]